MSLVLKKIIAGVASFGCVALSLVVAPALAQQSEEANPLLITFSKFAQTYEGDHDHRQFIRFSVPASVRGPLNVQVFDADTGGAFDEALGGYNTVMDYTLYGADGQTLLSRGDSGAVVEQVSGTAIARVGIGRDKDYDGRWANLFSVDVDAGKRVDGRREFVIMVAGMKGNDGNVFDVRISREADRYVALEGLKLFSYLPTIRMPQEGHVTELSFMPPAGSDRLRIENFDTARGEATFASRHRSVQLEASGQDEWARSTVVLQPREQGKLVSVTLGGGSETPNDASFFVADGQNNPVAINLPPKSFAVNERPIAALSQVPLSCTDVEFDARGSYDPDGAGSALTYRWTFDDNSAQGSTQEGARIVHEFSEPGTFNAELEVFDASGQVGDGARLGFKVVVKSPPVAAFKVPDMVAQGANVALDARASVGTLIETYRWTLGNGDQLNASDARSDYAYSRHGNYEISLRVSEARTHPCNWATMSRQIAVNAPPIADAGGDRDLTTGKISTFDASASRDVDGTIVSYVWDFGDGQSATGQKVQHTFHRAGDYAVQLQVSDDTGFVQNRVSDEILARVTAAPNQRPIALAGEDRQVNAGQVVLFDATRSSDADGQIIDTMWDFGDGTGGNRLSIEHTYWQTGVYELSLTLRDNSGQSNDTAVDSATITVVAGKNQLPIIDMAREITGTTFTQVHFDASGSDDRDGSIVRYDWDFGDGSRGRSAMSDHAYKVAGIYRAKLIVHDNQVPVAGLSEQEILVSITDEVNRAPVANAGQNLASVVGQEIRFDGSASRDQQGTIASYRWDFGDGHHGFGVSPNHIYQFAGDYQVTLMVRDNDLTRPLSNEAVISVVVAASDNQVPVAVAGPDLVVSQGEIIHFDGTASRDPDGSITAYQWDFGNGRTSQAAQPVFAYHETGRYRVKLQVRDDHLALPAMAQDSLEVEVRARTQAGDDQ